MDWKHLVAYITGTVDQELLLRNEYLVTENRMLRHQITGRVRLTDAERKTLAVIGHKLGKQALAEVATIVKPETILGWHRTLVVVYLYLLSASLLTPVASRNLLLYQSLPFSIPNRHVILWRRKDDTGVGTTARGIVERLSGVPRRVPSDGGPSGRVRGALSTGA